jgi:uncharacterized iron-regulated protein
MSAALSDRPDDGADLIGSYHTIGSIGPPYQVVARAAGGNVTIMLLESGEVVEYPARDVREDPAA